MALPEKQFEKLKEMQILCSQLERDIQTLKQYKKNIAEIHKRCSVLDEEYQASWLTLIESPELDGEQRKRIEALVPKGHYSIFWEDTIWNALSDIRLEYIALLKTLAQKIS